MNDPTFIKYPPAYNLNVEILPPPPPPLQKQNGAVKIFLIIFMLMLIIGVSVVGLLSIKNFQSRTAAQTIPTSYSAADLVKDFQVAHLKLWSVQYGKSINAWDSAYSIPVPFTSSATLSDITDCTGPCTSEQIGLWVYATSADAFSAYQEIINTTPVNGGGYLGVLTAYVHGRCLLLGPGPTSAYVQIMIANCT